MAIEEILNNPTGEEIESVRDLTPAEEEIIVQEDGTAEVTLEDKPLMEEAKAMGLFDDEDLPMDVQDHSANLAEILDDSDLRAIGSELLDSFERDQNSREEYDTIAEEGVDLLGFKSENSDEPFPGAASASHPVLAQAVVKFQAKAYKELFPTEGPIRTRIVG